MKNFSYLTLAVIGFSSLWFPNQNNLAETKPIFNLNVFENFDPLNTQKNLPEKIAPSNSNLKRETTLKSKSSNKLNNSYSICDNTKELKLHNINELDVIDITLCNNPKTREIWANTLYQAANLGIAKSDFFPTISANLDASKSYSKQRQSSSNSQNRSGRLNFTWLLYDFGGRSARVNQADFLLQSAISTQNSTIQTLILNSLIAFYDAKARQAYVFSTKEAELTAAESYNAAKTKYEVGITTPADVLQAQTAHSQAVLNHIKAIGDYKISLANLLNTMGVSLPETTTNLENLITPFDINTIRQNPKNWNKYTHKQLQNIKKEISIALENRPDLLALKQQIEASKENLKIIKTQFLPSINLSGSYNKQYSDIKSGNSSYYYDSNNNFYSYSSSSNNSYWTNSNNLTLSINIPIFSGFSTYYQQKAAEQQIVQNEARYQTLENSIGNEIWVAYENLNTAFQSIRTTTDLVQSALKSYEMALGRYKSGVGNLIDVLTTQSALASARQQKIQALLDWQKTKTQLAYALGNLDYTVLDK